MGINKRDIYIWDCVMEGINCVEVCSYRKPINNRVVWCSLMQNWLFSYDSMPHNGLIFLYWALLQTLASCIYFLKNNMSKDFFFYPLTGTLMLEWWIRQWVRKVRRGNDLSTSVLLFNNVMTGERLSLFSCVSL